MWICNLDQIIDKIVAKESAMFLPVTCPWQWVAEIKTNVTNVDQTRDNATQCSGQGY